MKSYPVIPWEPQDTKPTFEHHPNSLIAIPWVCWTFKFFKASGPSISAKEPRGGQRFLTPSHVDLIFGWSDFLQIRIQISLPKFKFANENPWKVTEIDPIGSRIVFQPPLFQGRAVIVNFGGVRLRTIFCKLITECNLWTGSKHPSFWEFLMILGRSVAFT